jgi:ubiquinone/menaquinone biosynthesis C-methylase UbiE
MGLVDKLMDVPALYSLVQKVIAGNLHEKIKEQLMREVPDLPGTAVLDVGCGPGNYASNFQRSRYVGFDLNARYIADTAKKCAAPNRTFLTMDATDIKLDPKTFDAIFSVGLYHHLDDSATTRSLHCLKRLIKDGGKIAIFDAVLPLNRLNVLGWAVRKMDRGRFVRSFDAYQKLVRGNFTTKKMEYVRCGVLDYVYYEL